MHGGILICDGVYTKPGLSHGLGHGPSCGLPCGLPYGHPKFCHFTNYKEKITTYVNKDQALEIRVIAAIFYQIRPQGVPGLMFN